MKARVQEVETSKLTPEEYLKLIPKLPTDVLNDDHRVTHRMAGQLKRQGLRAIGKGWDLKALRRVHDAIVMELARRFEEEGKEYHHTTPLKEQVKKLHEAAPERLMVVPDYVCVVGSSVDDPERARDLDILVREDHIPSPLKLEVARALGKDPSEIHWIANPKGPHGNYIPLYHLELVKAEPKVVHIPDTPPRGSSLREAHEPLESVAEGEEGRDGGSDGKSEAGGMGFSFSVGLPGTSGAGLVEALAPIQRFEPMRSTGGFREEEFTGLEDLWENWAKERIDQGIAVEPKYNGLRTVIQKAGDRVVITFGESEDSQKDRSGNLPRVVNAVKRIPGDVILDGELLEIVDGKPTPRVDLAKFRDEEGEVDDSHAVVFVFDVLYYDGRDLTGLPWVERQKVLRRLPLVRPLVRVKPFLVASKGELIRAVRQAEKAPGSEGAMLKEVNSRYVMGRAKTWAKIKHTEDIDVVVLEVYRTKGGTWNYLGGVAVDPVLADEYTPVVELNGRPYVVLGKTFNTTKRFKVGDIIEVAVTEINVSEERGKRRVAWQDPLVKDLSGKPNPDTVNKALAIAKLLGGRVEAAVSEAARPKPKAKADGDDGDGGEKLTYEGEQSGFTRTDFMAEEPDRIPVTGKLWVHVNGISAENITKDLEELLRTPVKEDPMVFHLDMRFDWRTGGSPTGKRVAKDSYLEGITWFIGNQEDFRKLFTQKAFGATIKLKQPRIWNDKGQLHMRLFPPGSPGNTRTRKHGQTWGKMFLFDEVEMLPSRLRPSPKGKRYFEFYLKFKRHPKLNGLWQLSEEGGEAVGLPFLLTKLPRLTPFWVRNFDSRDKGKRAEIRGMPDWQKPTPEQVRSFLGVDPGFSIPDDEEQGQRQGRQHERLVMAVRPLERLAEARRSKADGQGRRERSGVAASWDVVIIEAGLSKNVGPFGPYYYPPEVLKGAAKLFEGAPVHVFGFGKCDPDSVGCEVVYGHLPDPIKEAIEKGYMPHPVKEVVGFLYDVRYDESVPGLVARFDIAEEHRWLDDLIRIQMDRGRETFGLSIDAAGELEAGTVNGMAVTRVAEIHDPHLWVDVVDRPAAGGGFLKPSESQFKGELTAEASC